LDVAFGLPVGFGPELGAGPSEGPGRPVAGFDLVNSSIILRASRSRTSSFLRPVVAWTTTATQIGGSCSPPVGNRIFHASFRTSFRTYPLSHLSLF